MYECVHVFCWNTPYHGCQLHPQTETEAMAHGQSRHRDKCSRWMDRDKLCGIHAWLLGIVKLLVFCRVYFQNYWLLPVPSASHYIVSFNPRTWNHVVRKRMPSKAIATLSCPLVFLAFQFNILAVTYWLLVSDMKWHGPSQFITLWEAWDLCWTRSIFCLLGPLTPLNGKNSRKILIFPALSCGLKYRKRVIRILYVAWSRLDISCFF